MKPTRRTLLAGAGLPLAGRTGAARPGPSPEDWKIYWGDLHNHNNVGYAQGSLPRSFEIARNHLDFFAFTPHAHWHDIGAYENRIEDRWKHGFAVTRARWPDVVRLAREFDAPGRFVTILGYEWHSESLGDFHILFPDLDAELRTPDELAELQRYARERGALLIPHHPANRRGHRGANPEVWDPELSPVIEIYSEWGNAEHDRAPFPYIRHTEGGRWTRNTWQYLLAQGHRLGVIASSDDHLGYPGAYREGLAAVLVGSLCREAIFDALRRRRCYAVTGDRIELDLRVNGAPMGSQLAYVRDRVIEVRVRGWDQIDRVELVKNNRVLHRDFPQDRRPGPASWQMPVLVRFEYGWGPWPVLAMGRICDWNVAVRLEGGTLEALQPCFQSGPLSEARRDRITAFTAEGFRLESFTALLQQFEDVSTKAVVMRIRGGPRTRLRLELTAPARQTAAYALADLAESGEALFTGPFPKESGLVHRLVFADHYQTAFAVQDRDEGKEPSWYYVRVAQANGQLAWSSPIWVERA